ncbi:MAG: prepilin-type N-terminal cleavage/methylation domain-containing protein [Chromatiales bacterium]|nr:prepilin-type N-terminal cleavage/methylation domain-containing protein [Chromatiales bacterium]
MGQLTKAKTHSRTRRYRGGFTFVELMVSLALLGVLLAVASRYYGQAITKTIAADALGFTAAERNHVQEYFAVTGRWPQRAREQEERDPRWYPTVEVDNGTVTMRFSDEKANRLNGSRLSFRPVTLRDGEGATLYWQCGPGPLNENFEPVGADRTDLPAQNRITDCREPISHSESKTIHE